MTIAELIQHLQDIIEDADVDENTEVRLAMQPSYPFEYSIGNVVHVEGLGEKEETVVYIGEGQQLSYLAHAVSEELGWR